MPVTDPEKNRLLVGQLMREHREICWLYGLDLQPPLIELSVLKRSWGSWSATDRTIRLAERMVMEQPWDRVIGVLKHETAHQIVTEKLGGGSGHGDDFQRACRMIAVPGEFRTSTGDLGDEAGADRRPSRNGRMMGRVRKLFSLAASSNEHEAARAMDKARELIVKYNVRLAEGPGEIGFSSRIISLQRKRLERYHRVICTILMDHFFVEVILTSLFDSHRLEVFRAVDLIGEEGNVMIAEYVLAFLLERLPSLWQRQRSLNGWGGAGRLSFFLGTLEGFQESLEIKRAGDIQAAESAMLVLGRGSPALTDFVRNKYPRLTLKRGRELRIRAEVFEQGVAQGRKLKINPPLAERGHEPGLLLTG